MADKILAIFAKEFTDNKFVVDSTTEIGPKVGKDLRDDALIAVLVSAIGMILYIAWRFEFSFGVAAGIATFHDVLSVLGIFYLLGKEVNLLLITALLTVAGYSLTDTVVIYDRIRENLRLRPRDHLGRCHELEHQRGLEPDPRDRHHRFPRAGSSVLLRRRGPA